MLVCGLSRRVGVLGKPMVCRHSNASPIVPSVVTVSLIVLLVLYFPAIHLRWSLTSDG